MDKINLYHGKVNSRTFYALQSWNWTFSRKHNYFKICILIRPSFILVRDMRDINKDVKCFSSLTLNHKRHVIQYPGNAGDWYTVEASLHAHYGVNGKAACLWPSSFIILKMLGLKLLRNFYKLFCQILSINMCLPITSRKKIKSGRNRLYQSGFYIYLAISDLLAASQ